MNIFELAALLQNLMMNSADNQTSIRFLDIDTGETFDIQDVTYDGEAGLFFVMGAMSDE